MVKITSSEELRDWLADKPADWAQVIAVRAALRAFPTLADAKDNWLLQSSQIPLRALILSSAISIIPEYDMEIAIGRAYQVNMDNAANYTRSAAGARNSSNMSEEAVAAYRAADKAFHATNGTVNAAGNAALSSAYARRDKISAIDAAVNAANASVFLLVRGWQSIESDCDWLTDDSDAGTAAERLTRLHLWPYSVPEGWMNQWLEQWHNLAGRLLAIDPNYAVWTEWFDRRITGNAAAFDIPGDVNRVEDKRILMLLAEATDEDFWGKGHEYVNAALNDWLTKARARANPIVLDEPADVVGSITPTEKVSKSTFFISYATIEEPMAREVAAILNELGYPSIAQFKDFQQGNFVRLMREGIAAADRFIALQSKAYWESDHCQSEWDAAYASDPGAKRRRIVPFLLEPAPLPPIASETVYKSLIGLTKAQRKKVIVEWIEYQPAKRSPEQLRETLAKQASPDIRVRDEKIDAEPNAVFDKPLVDMDLAELPANLRALLDVLIASLPSNTPLVLRNCLKAYQNHLVERGAQPFVGTIEPFAAAVRVQIETDAGYWDSGLESLFADFFKRHELLITHFPINPERELLLAETPIDEFKASGDALLAPIKSVADAISKLKSADLTTEDFDRVEQAHQEFSRDIASLPMPMTNDDVTPKRRYVLGTIGFYERLLAALGAAAEISATPLGRAAINAVGSAIATLMAFVL